MMGSRRYRMSERSIRSGRSERTIKMFRKKKWKLRIKIMKKVHDDEKKR